MKKVLLIFPHQLFENHPGFNASPDEVVLIEDNLFFGDQRYPCNFHRQKLVLHRASMKFYEAFLAKKYHTHYYEYDSNHLLLKKVLQNFAKQKILVADPVDFILSKRLKRISEQNHCSLEILSTPLFLNSKQDNITYRAGKKRWFMANFYQWQRKRLGVLMENGKPRGGKWSFDEENRKKIPKSSIESLPVVANEDTNLWVREAIGYVNKTFDQNIGSVENFIYPTTFEEAKKWLQKFLSERLSFFGPYEDAIVADQPWLYHSVITPALNVGLITPQTILNETLQFAATHSIPLPSLEGFIRQVIGWREFMRATYEDLGVTMRTTNHWQHHRKIPLSFYTGTTGIDPIDNTIQRLREYAYCHHIERLMVLGGFMFLCEFDPDEIYRWFMEFFIDSYDWVMVPNVYAMSQNADGGQITTKPYFSGSAYIKKMSHYPSGPWVDVWDGLYWRFIIKHSEQLKENPRWAMMVRMAEKMEQNKKNRHQQVAENFLATL